MILALALAACTGDKEDTGPAPAPEGCPEYSGFMKEGQTWLYSLPAYLEAAYESDIRMTYTLSTFADDAWVLDYTVLMWAGTASESTTTGQQTGVCDETGIGILTDDYTFVASASGASSTTSTTYDAPVHWMIHNLAADSRWEENVVGTKTINEDTTELQGQFRYHVEDTKTWTLQVGSFDTYEVQADEGAGEYPIWYAPDVGMVETEDGYEFELDAFTVPE
jgi:hypothetical protein